MILAAESIAGLLIAIVIYGWFFESAAVQVKEHIIPVDPRHCKKPVRILFLSDLHAGFFSSRATQRRVLATIARSHQEQPYELVIWGGDFVHNNARYMPAVLELVATVAAWNVPMYGVLGNHDHNAPQGSEAVVQPLEEAGVTMLRNEAREITLPGGRLLIVGLDDIQSYKGYVAQPGNHYKTIEEYRNHAEHSDLLKQFDEIQPELPRILVSHNPDAVYMPRSVVPTVVLSGHTHGGQFWPLTWIGPRIHRVMPTGSFVTWAGERLLNRTTLIVSRGIGGSLVPFRFLCRPNVIALTLQPQALPNDLVIGVSGKARSGKDTVANMIQSLMPGVTRIGFSYAVKKAYDAIHGTDTLHDEHVKDLNRVGLNKLGEEKRAIDPDYWVKQTMKERPPLLISDVRLLQEAAAVKNAGGILIRIEARHSHRHDRLGEHRGQEVHKETETALDEYDDWDYVIHNEGTLLDLERAVRYMSDDILDHHHHD